MAKCKLKVDGRKFVSPTASYALLSLTVYYRRSMKKHASDYDMVLNYGPYHEKFVLKVAEIMQAKFGKVCRVNGDLLKASWYEAGLPEDKYDPAVIRRVVEDAENEKVQEYERWCEYVLRWLRRNSAITFLNIS